MKKTSLLLATGIILAALTGCAASGSPSAQNSGSGESLSDEAASDRDGSGGSADQAPPVSPNTSAALVSHANSITVNSSEKVTVVPDIAQVEYAVRTESSDAASCQQKNTEAVAQVIELLKSLNIEESSIQTSEYYMNPVYNYSGNTPRVTGYEAIATLTVSDLPIDGLDEILSKSVSTGINTIRSITYQASGYDESYQQALTAAVESARRKAEALAGAAGCSVGNVVNITETSGYSQARYTDQALASKYRSSAKMELAATAEDSTGIMPGEIQVEASIVVEYQIY